MEMCSLHTYQGLHVRYLAFISVRLVELEIKKFETVSEWVNQAI